jgi:hypothetical protein
MSDTAHASEYWPPPPKFTTRYNNDDSWIMDKDGELLESEIQFGIASIQDVG